MKIKKIHIKTVNNEVLDLLDIKSIHIGEPDYDITKGAFIKHTGVISICTSKGYMNFNGDEIIDLSFTIVSESDNKDYRNIEVNSL